MNARVAFYLSSAIIWLSSLYYDVNYQPRLGHEWYIYKLIMLTNINFALTTVYSAFAFVSAICHAGNRLKSFLDFVFYTTLFPAGMTACLLFWCLYAIDPSLIMPDWVAALIPSWLNHVTHTLPVPYLIIDMLLTKRLMPTQKTTLLMSVLLVTAYFSVVCFVRMMDGYWVYPLFSLLSTEDLIVFFILSIISFYLLMQFGMILARHFH